VVAAVLVLVVQVLLPRFRAGVGVVVVARRQYVHVKYVNKIYKKL
jgi:hypothetical protein